MKWDNLLNILISSNSLNTLNDLLDNPDTHLLSFAAINLNWVTLKDIQLWIAKNNSSEKNPEMAIMHYFEHDRIVLISIDKIA